MRASPGKRTLVLAALLVEVIAARPRLPAPLSVGFSAQLGRRASAVDRIGAVAGRVLIATSMLYVERSAAGPLLAAGERLAGLYSMRRLLTSCWDRPDVAGLMSIGERPSGFGRSHLVAQPEFAAAARPESSYRGGGLPTTEVRSFG